MELTLEVTEQKIICRFVDSAPQYKTLTAELIAQLEKLCNAYQEMQNSNNNETLLNIGHSLFELINYSQQSVNEWLNSTGSRQLVIFSDVIPTKQQQLLLSLPWEVLAFNQRFLVDDILPFEVVRSIGSINSTLPAAPYKDLTLAFMAADPELNSNLNYEAEEQAIFNATKHYNNLNLIVDESGNLEQLNKHLLDAGHCDILHLSCHGGFDSEQGFVLYMEDDHFALQAATAFDFLYLKDQISALFLSACHSASISEKQSLMIDLVRLGIANIIGWEGSVADDDATQFSSYFYQALQKAATIPFACAFARQSLFKNKRPHWHLARSYLGFNGGHPLITPDKPSRPKRRGKPCHELLDKLKKEVRVASRDTFVGRRWQTKQAINSFTKKQQAGVLLYGIGGTGKSSLAARILDRLEPVYKAAVIYKNYQAIDVLDVLKNAARGDKTFDFKECLTELQEDPDSLKNILIDLLEEVFNQLPIVLVIDDLEQYVLQKPDINKNIMLKAEYQALFIAIIEAFHEADTASRLLLTSRYQFQLNNQYGENLCQLLELINVPDFSQVEQEKYWLALLKTSQTEERDKSRDNNYLEQIYSASLANAGLQYVLTQPLLSGELNTLEHTLKIIKHYQAEQTGTTNATGSDLDKYMQRIALEQYSRALSDSEYQLLRVLTLFDFAIPEESLLKAAPGMGIDDPHSALQRLDNFGLINHWYGEGLEDHLSCYGLAEKVVAPLEQEDRNFLTKIFVPIMWRIWFKDFLIKYSVPESDSLQESMKYISTHHFPRTFKGTFPLYSQLDQGRIALLHRLCIKNSLVSWSKFSFDRNTFISYLELSLSLNTFEKLRVSSSALSGLSIFQFQEFYKVFDEEREQFKALALEDPQGIIGLIFETFAGRSEILRQAYLLYLGDLDHSTSNVLNKINPEDKESHYKAATVIAEKSKKSKDKGRAYCNYADFLADQKADYPAAEAMYERAIKADPNQANNLGNYANFLKGQKADYPAAEAMYERAIKADPNHANILGNYANFLTGQKADYPAAEAMHERAIKADPNQANKLGNYAQILFILNKKTQAKETLLQAEKLQGNEAPDLSLELAFYRYAHCQPQSLDTIKTLLHKNIRSPGWNLDNNVHRAMQDGHPYKELLAAIANVISANKDIDTLSQFPQWNQ